MPRMPRRPTIFAAALAVLTLGGGCTTSATSEPFARDDPNLEVQPTVRAALTGVAAVVEGGAELVGLRFRPAPIEYARQLGDESTTAEKRRKAINGLVDREFGQGEPYTDLYASIAADRDAENPLVRATAVRALNRSEAQGRTELFIRLLDDEDVRIRLEAAKALSKLPNDEAVTPLLETAGDANEDLDVRLASTFALRHYAEPEVVERLTALLDAEPFALAFQARVALVRMLGLDRGYDRDAWLAAS